MSNADNDSEFGSTIARTYQGSVFLDRYEMRKIVGRGGMGVVWLAYDQRLEREVALKFLPDTLAADRGAVTELRDETRRGIELNHSNIVRLYDFLTDDGAAAISMEYVDGKTLAESRCDQRGGIYEVEDLKDWAVQMCEALEYAHSRRKTVHRDIKPHNLMVTGDGELKITDFGISSTVHDSVSRLSRSDQDFSGTLAYMSPQQFLGRPSTPADDLYSLGATLYELLTGKPPFFRGNIQAQIEKETPPSIAERRDELGIDGDPIPKSWEQAIACCLEKEPDDRPRDAREFLGMLHGKIRPVSRKASGVPTLLDRAGGKKGILIGAGSALVAGVVITAIMLTGGSPDGGAPAGGETKNVGPSLVGDLSSAKVEEKKVGNPTGGTPPEPKEPENGSGPKEPVAQKSETIGSLPTPQKTVAEAEAALEKEREQQVKDLNSAYKKTLDSVLEVENSLEAKKMWEGFLAEHAEVQIGGSLEDEDILSTAQGKFKAASSAHSEEVAKIERARKELERKLNEVVELSAKTDGDLVEQGNAWRNLVGELQDFKDPYSESQNEIAEKAKAELAAWETRASGKVIGDRDDLFEGGRYSAYYDYTKRQILKDAQTKLKEAGLYESSIDGIPGGNTHKAIVAYQEKKGLIAAGRLSDETIEALELGDYKNTAPPPTPKRQTNYTKRTTSKPRPTPAQNGEALKNLGTMIDIIKRVR